MRAASAEDIVCELLGCVLGVLCEFEFEFEGVLVGLISGAARCQEGMDLGESPAIFNQLVVLAAQN